MNKGEKFGKWLVVNVRPRDKKHPRYLCKCECGTERWVLGYSLINGQSRDCGCENKIGFQLIAGRRFGHWLVLDEHQRGKNTRWLCRCDCGVERWVLKFSLVRGRSTSCGCEGHKRQSKAITKPEAGAAKHAVYLTYLKGALGRDLSFDLTKEQVLTIMQLPCAYCGLPPSQIRQGKGRAEPYIFSGIDRVDSSRGYSLDNCLPCCKVCNYAKGRMSLDEFKLWVERVYLHQQQAQRVIESSLVS